MNRVGMVAGMTALACMMAACTSTSTGDQYAAGEEWTKAIMEYRKDYRANPNDVVIKSKLGQMELQAANFYFHRGMRELESGNLTGAEVAFQQGLVAMPNNMKLQQMLNETLRQKEADTSYREGVRLLESGNAADGKRRLQRAVELYPGHQEAAAKLKEIQRQEDVRSGDALALSSTAPVTLNFREADIRDAFDFLAKSFGINVIFDDAVKNTTVTLYAKDMSFEQGLNLLLATSKTFYKKVGKNTILIALDSKDKRGQYEDQIVRTFQMNSLRAKEMADILKGLMTIRKIIVNEELNAITIRDTEEVIRLAERIIQGSDGKPAEVILEVEILEINRNKADKIGLDLGSYAIGANIPASPLTATWGAAKASGTLTVPSATFRFYKQDVDAKTLANPKIRVLNNKAAKIHIGDRVPLVATTIQDVTGQVRNTYDYKEIGIRLSTEPTIHIDNSVTVKLGLEVSSLGQNLGTTNQPAYSIGSRDAETYMLLRDGETAILGGLIRDDERNARVTIPGLGDIPALGSLFTSYDSSSGRTDVLLTITPHVVRGWDLPPQSEREFFSGTESNYSGKPLFASFNDAAGAAEPSRAKAGAIARTAGVPALMPLDTLAKLSDPVMLAFSRSSYEESVGNEFEIELTGQNLPGVASAPIEVLYNPQVMSFVRADAGSNLALKSFDVQADPDKGILTIKLDYPADDPAKGNGGLARLIMKGVAPGTSYLTYGTTAVVGAAGENIDAQTKASRVVIK